MRSGAAIPFIPVVALLLILGVRATEPLKPEPPSTTTTTTSSSTTTTTVLPGTVVCPAGPGLTMRTGALEAAKRPDCHPA